MQPGALKCYSRIDRQHTAGKCGQHMTIEPSSKHSTLGAVSALDLEHAHLEFKQSDR